MLAGLAVAPVAEKVYVFAPPQGWEISDSGIYTGQGITVLDLKPDYALLADLFFKPSPFLLYLEKRSERLRAKRNHRTHPRPGDAGVPFAFRSSTKDTGLEPVSGNEGFRVYGES